MTRITHWKIFVEEHDHKKTVLRFPEDQFS